MEPVKEPAQTADAAPDVRPISIGECLRRAIHTSIATQYKDIFRDHFWPQQVAVGVHGGLSLLVVGIQLVLELHPDWVVVKLDLKNAYNEIKRAAVLARLAESDSLHSLIPLTRAVYQGANDVYLASNGLRLADYQCAEGVHQGDPLSSAQFCAAIHPEVRQLDAELRDSGGSARFDMDDGYALGPPDEVFPAVLRFAARVHALGLELQVPKCRCFSVAADLENHNSRPSTLPVGEVTLQDGVVARGITISGVPVGEARYVTSQLACKVEDMVSIIQIVSTKLRDRHSQALWSVVYHCLQSKFQYWIQHCTPDVVASAAQEFDASVLRAVCDCIGDGTAEDPICMRRLRLPARMYGGGIRSMVDVAPAAFMGVIWQTVPLMADRLGIGGDLLLGFMPALTHALGVSLDAGRAVMQRLEVFAECGSRLGAAFRTAGLTIQAEAATEDEDAIARILTSSVGERRGIQRAITQWREKQRFQKLDVDIRALAPGDMRRAAWLNLDRFSTTWVTAWPSDDTILSNPEFREIATFFFGMPSPACAGLVGEKIGNTNDVLDAFGVRLAAATLPGDGWRTQHDAIKWRIAQDAREMHVRLRTEVYGLFAASIPQAARAQADRLSARKRQGLVPDFMLYAPLDGPERALLVELKALHYGSATYPQRAAARCNAVARRAGALPAEYARKARQIDQQYCGTARGQVGPMAAKLLTFEPVRGIVFGAWGEASPTATKLLSLMSEMGAERHWRGMRCEDSSRARGAIAWMLRRRWGLTALREAARLKLDRLEYVGSGAMAAVERRHRAEEIAARRRSTAEHLRCGPRSRAVSHR